jgi:hypothetical protein
MDIDPSTIEPHEFCTEHASGSISVSLTIIPIEVQSTNITFCVKNKFVDIEKMWFPMDSKGT